MYSSDCNTEVWLRPGNRFQGNDNAASSSQTPGLSKMKKEVNDRIKTSLWQHENQPTFLSGQISKEKIKPRIIAAFIAFSIFLRSDDAEAGSN